MKTTYRRMRRKTAPVHEGNFFKKENHEQGFFGEQTVTPFFNAGHQNMQRKCGDCAAEEMKKEEEGDKKMMHKSEGETDKEKDIKLHKKEASTQPATGGVGNYVGSLSGNGAPLPAPTRHFFEQRIGHDLSKVKIHTNTDAARSAKAVNAKAYTVGAHIVFSNGAYDPTSKAGATLLAHELVHVVQQDEQTLARKEAPEPDCNEELNLEGLTDAVYNKDAGTVIGEKKKEAKDCEDCEDDCKQITGLLKVPYKVATTVTLPSVPDNLRPCQQARVSAAIAGKLAPHEQRHVAAFRTFNGSPLLPINYKGCEAGYNSYLEGLAETEFERRKTIADDKSAKLDPYTIDVDLCCKDTPVKKK